VKASVFAMETVTLTFSDAEIYNFFFSM